jgi:hypothetical protein
MPKMLLVIELARILPRERIRKTEKEGKQWRSKTMKLRLLFLVMELLTLLAYPIVFVHGRLHQFLESKERIPVSNLSIIVPVTPDS